MYLSHSSRFVASAGENFQFFSASSMRARNRRLCSSFDTFRKILSTAMPFSDRYFSKLLIFGRLESMVKGFAEPNEYFALFRNSELDDHGDFAWFGQHVATMFDDHDQIHKGSEKRRFCGMAEYRKLIFSALAVNLTTAGIPCIYYGTEQGFESGSRPSPSD